MWFLKKRYLYKDYFIFGQVAKSNKILCLKIVFYLFFHYKNNFFKACKRKCESNAIQCLWILIRLYLFSGSKNCCCGRWSNTVLADVRVSLSSRQHQKDGAALAGALPPLSAYRGRNVHDHAVSGDVGEVMVGRGAARTLALVPVAVETQLGAILPDVVILLGEVVQAYPDSVIGVVISRSELLVHEVLYVCRLDQDQTPALELAVSLGLWVSVLPIDDELIAEITMNFQIAIFSRSIRTQVNILCCT